MASRLIGKAYRGFSKLGSVVGFAPPSCFWCLIHGADEFLWKNSLRTLPWKYEICWRKSKVFNAEKVWNWLYECYKFTSKFWWFMLFMQVDSKERNVSAVAEILSQVIYISYKYCGHLHSLKNAKKKMKNFLLLNI